MLKISHLKVAIEGQDRLLLKGINLSVQAGEVHAIMGKQGYTVTAGNATFLDKNLLDLAPEKRAAAGLFLAFQYPVEIPGVSMTNFLKTAINQIREQQDQPGQSF